jgi:outer membrane lipoprotein SlyB
MSSLKKLTLSIVACFSLLGLNIQARSYQSRHERDANYNRRHSHHYHDPYRGERMAKGAFGGAAAGGLIGGLAGGGRGAGIGLGVGALAGLMAGSAASESHRYDDYNEYEEYDNSYSNEPQGRRSKPEFDQEDIESQNTSESETPE